MEKRILYDEQNELRSGLTISQFNAITNSHEEDNNFFWISGEHKINNLDGVYKIGFLFKNQVLFQIECFRIDGFSMETTKNDDEKRYYDLKQSLLGEGFENTDIHYSYDCRNGYGSVIVSF